MALLKPGNDKSIAKSIRPISLPCLTYKLFERLILNRIAEHVDAKLIAEQAGFRAGKSCTSQLLNLTEHIEDGYEKRLITGAVFVDLSAAYDTVNQTLLRGAEREEEPLATTTKRTTTGKCTGTDVVQHLHQSRATFSERGPDETFQSSSRAGVTTENPK